MARDAGVRWQGDDLGIVTLTFDRADVHNALDWAAMDAFAGCVRRLGAETADGGDAVRAVILTGAGSSAFCSGGDQAALASCTSVGDGERLTTVMGDALRGLEALPVPVIAAVNGHALGGGAEIALACDIRIAAENARFGLVHARLALIPGWGAGQRLLRTVGYGRAMEMLLTGRVVSAGELATIGVVEDVVGPGEAQPRAHALATRIAQLDPAVVRAVKRLLRAGLHQRPAEAFATERSLFPGLWAGASHVDAMQGFSTRGERAGR